MLFATRFGTLRDSTLLVVRRAFAGLASLLLPLVSAHPATITETFDSSATAAAQGWLGLANTNDGNNYGWSGTGFAGGSSGEAGGLFNHATNMSFYAVPLGVRLT